MSYQPLATAIIPAKDSAATLPGCLRALLSQPPYRLGADYEIIVVDDGSQDETAAIAEQFGVRVIRQANAGPAAARNTGAAASRAEFLLFTDSDCTPQPDWMASMLAPFADPLVMGVKGAYLCRQPNPVARFVQIEFEHKYERMARQPAIDFIDTYSAAYRRAIFMENGGFDERFPVPSVEDQEFSFRLARKGYKLVFQPAARVFHAHDLTAVEYARRKWGIGYWKAFMLRWLPEKTLSDTYTPASQRWQILFFAIFLLTLLLAVFWRPLWPLPLLSITALYLSAIPFLRLVRKKDPRILAPGLLLLPLRAAGLGFGLLCGFIFPPRVMQHRQNRAEQPASGAAFSHSAGPHFAQYVFKRSIDLIGGVIGLILGAPIVCLAAVAIKLDSPGGVIFSQERAGENGKPFRLYKLRTMYSGSGHQHLVPPYEALRGDLPRSPNPDCSTLPSLLLGGIGGGLQGGAGGGLPKSRNDPRVTRVGRFLRRWSLDEIPQFWNILKGEMSLVGPRPEETWLVAQYTGSQRRRLVVKPGLTGPMQVSGRADLSPDQRLACELDYIQNYSLWLDFKILWKSIAVVLSGKGAY